jgi:hypothetical protein
MRNFSSYAEANQATATIRDGVCGLSDHSAPGDWRLPTLAEWETTIARGAALRCGANEGFFPALTDREGTGCYKDEDESLHVFTNLQGVPHWSSTSSEDNPTIAWAVRLAEGYAVEALKSNVGAVYFWPVRDGR